MRRVIGWWLLLSALMASLASAEARGDIPPPPPTAHLSVTPSSWDFGNVNVGVSTETVLTALNDGSVDLTLDQITVAAPFTVTPDTCSNTVLVPYNSCTLTVRFAPPSGLGYGSDLQVPYRDPDTQLYTATVTLSGAGVVTTVPMPDISIDRTTLSFGAVNVGATMSTAVTVSNTGDADLRIDGIALGGAAASEFSQSNTCTAPLPPQATCTITVRFSPVAPGAKSGTVTIASNDPDESLLTVPSSGTGITPSSTGDKGSEGGCFIATAAYGSYLDPHVMSLRKFRDEHLLTNPLGRSFVAFYYRTSPPIAASVEKHTALRTAARLALSPLVFGVEYPRLALVCVIAAGAAWYIGKRKGRRAHKKRERSAAV